MEYVKYIVETIKAFNWNNWFPAISLVTILGFVISIYNIRLRGKIDRSIESIKHQLRIDEEKIKAELKRRDDTITYITKSFADSSSKKRDIVASKNIEAIEKAYANINSTRTLFMLNAFMKKFKFKEILSE